MGGGMDTLPAIGQLVRAPKTAELIAGHLRGQIVRGELPAGDTLPPETDLMHQFGVSRPTLREAFRILETESLIRVRRGSRGGAQVTAPDIAVAARYVGLLLQMQATTVGDVYEARTVLEPPCARMVAAQHTADDIATLRGLIEDIRTLVDSDSVSHAQWPAATYRFHEALVRCCGNFTLAVQAGMLTDIVSTHLSTWIQRSVDQPDAVDSFRLLIRSFERLVDLIEAGDEDGAELHWRRHMEVAGAQLLSGVDASAVVDLFY
jgi:DNA-binding FadR family transcriptional regulator